MFLVCGDDDGSVWKWVQVAKVVFDGVSGNAWILRGLEVAYRGSGREDL